MIVREIAMRMHGNTLWVATALLIAAWWASAPAHAQASPADGARLFQQQCVACHTLGGGRLVGPDLKGVTERRSREWIVRFIVDPASMLKEDPTAIALFKEYGIPMPNLGLDERQANALLAHLEGGQVAPGGTPAQYLPTLLISLLAAIALTWVALIAGSKKAHGGLA